MANPFDQLTNILRKFPAIGSKSAQRIAFYLFSMPDKNLNEFVNTVRDLKKNLKYCSICFNISKNNPCDICSDPSRNDTQLCVVADQKDLLAIEKSGAYKGKYHILGGVISPLDGIYPEMLKITELINRIENGVITEVVLAISPTVEGEATIIYLSKFLKKFEVELTRIAYGLPMGADLDYVDESTITQAVEGRVRVE